MTELAAALSADAGTALIEGEVTAGACYAIDGEVIRVQGPDFGADYWPPRRTDDSWVIDRAIGGTAAEHAEGAELTAVVPSWGTGPLSGGSGDLSNVHEPAISLSSDSGDIGLHSAGDVLLAAEQNVTIAGAAVQITGGSVAISGAPRLLGPFVITFDALSQDNNDPTVLGDIAPGALIWDIAAIIVTNWDFDAGFLSISIAPAGDVADSSTVVNDVALASAAFTGAEHQGGPAPITHALAVTPQKLVCIVEGVIGVATQGEAHIYALVTEG